MALSPRLQHSRHPAIYLEVAQRQARDRVEQRLLDGTYATEPVSCFCGEREGLLVAARDRYGLPVQTVLCPRCGLLRTSPRMSRTATNQFYREDYRDLYSGLEGRSALRAAELRHGQVLLETVRPWMPPDAIVYEVGCGSGGNLVAFAEAGLEVAGCDLGGELLRDGRARGLPLVEGDIEALLCARAGCRADVVVVSHLVEHLLDLRDDLSGILRALCPGGLLLVEVPGLFCIPSAYRGDLLLYLQNAHTWHFTAPTLSFVLRSVGLEVLYANEGVQAVARWPLQPVDGRGEEPPRGEPRRLLRLLAALERQFLGSRVAPSRPMPTSASQQ